MFNFACFRETPELRGPRTATSTVLPEADLPGESLVGGSPIPGRIISQSGQFVFKHTDRRGQQRFIVIAIAHGDIPLPLNVLGHSPKAHMLAHINKHKRRKLINGHCADHENRPTKGRFVLAAVRVTTKLVCVCGFFSCKLQVTHINHERGWMGDELLSMGSTH